MITRFHFVKIAPAFALALILATSSREAFAARGSKSQACADRMASFADAASLTPTTKVKLTAAERESAEVIRGALEASPSSWRSRDFQNDVAPELRRALAQAPHLLERDPDSALRFAMGMLFHSTYRERDLQTMYLVSDLRFEGATLSKAEVQEVIHLLREYTPQDVRGLLGRGIATMEYAGRNPQVMGLAFEKVRFSVAYSAFKVVASQADASAKAELRNLFNFDRRVLTAGWHFPMKALRDGMVLVAPHGERGATIWRRAFHRLFDSTEAPMADVHVVENGLIRVSASDPFEGANPGLVGFERVFTAAQFQKLADSAGPDGLVLPVDGTRGGFKISRSILNEFGSIGRVAKTTGSAPPYEAWARDGKIQGLIWTDVGFGAADAHETIGEYLSFYRAQGFKFKKQELTDFPEWIESHVKSGELDYMVREGHLKRDLQMVRSGELRVGRKSGDPAQEVVLFIPNSRSEKTELTWSALNQALNARTEREPQSSLLYFDTKCSSFEGTACQLPSLAKSSQIQVVSSKGTATTFVNDETSPLRALMEGILEQDSYSKMNRRLQAARKKAGGAAAGEDNYILPNSDEYRKAVTDQDTPGGALEWVEK
jgi:hypothetical protein